MARSVNNWAMPASVTVPPADAAAISDRRTVSFSDAIQDAAGVALIALEDDAGVTKDDADDAVAVVTVAIVALNRENPAGAHWPAESSAGCVRSDSQDCWVSLSLPRPGFLRLFTSNSPQIG